MIYFLRLSTRHSSEWPFKYVHCPLAKKRFTLCCL